MQIMTLYCASDSYKDLSDSLSADLAEMANWVEKNGLRLNEAKTLMLLLSWKRKTKELENIVVKLKGQEVTRGDEVKYLDVWVDEGLTWRDHKEAVRAEMFW